VVGVWWGWGDKEEKGKEEKIRRKKAGGGSIIFEARYDYPVTKDDEEWTSSFFSSVHHMECDFERFFPSQTSTCCSARGYEREVS
jgi:hypothetical protein